MMAKIKFRRQRGVALLFTLGIISLLLVLGLAFVTTSIMARKVAANNSNRSQAKMLAQSAISRAALAIMVYSSELPTGSVASDFTDVHSYEKIDGNLGLQDQLKSRKYSLLNYSGNGVGYNGWEHADTSIYSYPTTWQLIKDNDNNIIGRVSYQVVPTDAGGHFNMWKVLGGFQSEDGIRPWTTRRGVGVEELYMADTNAFKVGSAQWWQGEGGSGLVGDKSEIPAYYDDLYNAFPDLFPASQKAEREKWIEHWFIEGKQAAEAEAFYYEDASQKRTLYHRFNLSDDVQFNRTLSEGETADEWYDRFLKEKSDPYEKNSEAAINNIVNTAKKFKDEEKYSPYNSGLPFLKRIIDDLGSFSSLEKRRRQVIANFNDYCDVDSIPTSDKAASTWVENIAVSSNWPTYTGNEKTPYINEVALGMRFKPVLSNGNGVLSGEKTVFNLEITPEMIAELIDIYGGASNAYTLHAKLNSFALTAKVTATYKIQYLKPKSPSGYDTITSEETTKTRTLGSFKAPNDDSAAISLDFSSRAFAGGYSSGQATFGAALQNADGTDHADSANFTSDITSLVPDGCTFDKLLDLSYMVKLETVKFGFSGIALVDNTADGNGVKHGVDFVRWNQQPLNIEVNKEIFKTVGADAEDEVSATRLVVEGGNSRTAWDTLSANGTYYYIGGMETRDPRQNLNFDGVTPLGGNTNYYDAADSDWRIRLAIYDAGKNKIASGTDWSSEDNFTIAITDAADDTRIGNGSVNSVSHPNAPGAGFTASEYDAEIVADPAWTATGRTGHLSTAFIRNKPMKSPWELGLIHRGAPWQTINLKNAISANATKDGSYLCDNDAEGGDWATAGTKYSDGDAGLLDQIKMTCNARSWGKVDVNRLHPDADGWTDGSSSQPGDPEIVDALFTNIFYDNNPADVWSTTSADDKLGKGYGTSPVEVSSADIGKLRTAFTKSLSAKGLTGAKYKYFLNRVDFLNWLMTDSNGINGENIQGINKSTDATDAENEELIGKTINLIGASTGGLPNVITALVVAQTIKDIGGNGIVRFDHDGEPMSKNCDLGTFDVELKTETADTKDPLEHVYFDEITGEVKLIATFERNPTTGKMVIRKIEYID